jgi:ribonuclease PH
MPRDDGRNNDEMREVSIKAGVNPYAEGSALCSFGRTQVLCTASLEEEVPRFLMDSGQGWVTAEYAMLPRSTHTRTRREANKKGRAQEISRLIGRSLRASVDLAELDGYTLRVDCDVMVADGGTRTASISGGYVALALALAGIGKKAKDPIAAISLGKVNGELMVDLAYVEDSAAEVDLNLVITKGGELVEVQGSAEKGLFSPAELGRMVESGVQAAEQIFAAQDAALAGDRD